MTSRVLAAVAALLSLGMLVAIFQITADQGDLPAWWYVGLLVVAIAGLGYGATRGPRRPTVLVSASVLTLMLGVLGIFSVGLPLLVAGVLGMVASSASGSVQPA